MSFIKELKRRNVFRVGVAYVIVAWLLLQVADVVLNNIDAPTWVFQAILLVLVIGFPLALFFAWAFELTPEGLKNEKDVDRSESITHATGRKLDFTIIVVLVVALAVFAVERFVLLPKRTPPTDARSEIVTTEIQQSIAVLPFVNMSSDPEQEYFSDGLTEEILNLLAKIPQLKVIGRTSSFAFKGKNEDLRSIGEALGVNTLLEGSVRKSGDRVRITAQLNDASDGSHIWSETYDRTMTDIFEVQDDVAAAIIATLQIHVGTTPARGRPTEDSEAYTLFLRARAHINKWQSVKATNLLLSVVERDPMFAEAYELLAYAHWLEAGTTIKSAKGQRLTSEAASQALAINPDLVLAQSLYLSANIDTYTFLGEIEALERAVRLEPSNPASFDMLAYDLIETGYMQEALEMAERFVELDPLSPAAHSRLAEAQQGVGRIDEAIESMEVAVQLDVAFGSFGKAIYFVLERRDEEAIAHLEAVMEQFDVPAGWVREFIIGARDPNIGPAFLDEQIPKIVASMPDEIQNNMSRILLNFYSYFGYFDRQFEIILDLDLNYSTWTEADDMIFAGNKIHYRGFTAHPKYLEAAELMGIVEVWEQRGPPDFCEKISDEWVCE